ncbi:UNVERIFIED_CONTAM: hypothetical protein K2H54_057747 [Gekko kuhli]
MGRRQDCCMSRRSGLRASSSSSFSQSHGGKRPPGHTGKGAEGSSEVNIVMEEGRKETQTQKPVSDGTSTWGDQPRKGLSVHESLPDRGDIAKGKPSPVSLRIPTEPRRRGSLELSRDAVAWLLLAGLLGNTCWPGALDVWGLGDLLHPALCLSKGP